MKESGLSAVIFGASGAVGATLIPILLSSEKWSRVHCVVRKEPKEWSQFPNKQKLSVQVEPDMDKLFKTEEWKLEGFDCMFVAFGTQVKYGEETFIKVDKTYPLLCADIAIANNIPQYHLVSSTGADSSSIFLYVRTKGEVEAELKAKKLNMLFIHHPGLIKNRPDARTGEKIMQCLCCCWTSMAIQCQQVAICLMKVGEKHADTAPTAYGVQKTFENVEMLNIAQN